MLKIFATMSLAALLSLSPTFSAHAEDTTAPKCLKIDEMNKRGAENNSPFLVTLTRAQLDVLQSKFPDTARFPAIVTSVAVYGDPDSKAFAMVAFGQDGCAVGEGIIYAQTLKDAISAKPKSDGKV